MQIAGASLLLILLTPFRPPQPYKKTKPQGARNLKTQDLKSVEEIDLLEGDAAHKEIGCALCMALRPLG